VILYDEVIYKMGHRKSTFANVDTMADVQQLNDLQWTSALENIYFDNTQPLDEIFRGNERNSGRRKAEKAMVSESIPTERADGMMSSIAMMSKPENKVRLHLDFFKQLKAMPDEEKFFGGVLVRDPDRVAVHDEFLKAREHGQYKASEFGKFMMDRYGPRSPVVPHVGEVAR
jgi:hypothetical protein